MTTALRELAKRAENDPFFLGSLLAALARAEGLDDEGLAARLGCRGDDLTLLRLCRAPREGEGFGDDVRAIAARFGLAPVRLAEAVKSVRVWAALRAASDAALQMAARDREETEP